MSDLLDRVRAKAQQPSRASGASGPTSRVAPVSRRTARRPLSVSALAGGLGGALGSLLVLMAAAITGWFLADAGAHGETTDALRVGADAWLVGHGAHLVFDGVGYTIVPLGLTFVLGWSAFRAGRWAGRTSPVDSDRDLAVGCGLFTVGYLVVAVVTAVLATTDDARVSLVGALIGAVVVGGGSGSVGLLVGADRRDAALSLVPDRHRGWVGSVARGALATSSLLLALAAILVLVGLVWHLDRLLSLASGLGLHGGDAVMLVVLGVALAPNAALFGAAYLLGPGFAVGVGTTVSPSVVALGPLPAFPLLTALPGDGPTPWFAIGAVAVPGLAAAIAVARVQRRSPVLAWDVSLLRGLGSGIGAAIVVAVLGGLAGGVLGDGRMADVGPSVPALLVAGTLSMGLGGVLGAAWTTWRQRRAARDGFDPRLGETQVYDVSALRADEEAEAEEHTVVVDPATEPTEVLDR